MTDQPKSGLNEENVYYLVNRDKTGLLILSLSAVKQTPRSFKKQRQSCTDTGKICVRGGHTAERWGVLTVRGHGCDGFPSERQRERVFDRRSRGSSIPAAPHPPDPQICSHTAGNDDPFKCSGKPRHWVNDNLVFYI